MIEKILDAVKVKKGSYHVNAALRSRVRLQPIGGPGDVIYPPTYAEGSVLHERVIEREKVQCVLIDSVASQANRMELALDATNVSRMQATIGDPPQEFRMSTLLSSHRFCDAELRTCENYPWDVLNNKDKLQIFGYSPNSLLLGMWHSDSSNGPGLKIPRAMTSEIHAVNCAYSPHAASRISTLPISAASPVDISEDGRVSLHPKRTAKPKEKGKVGVKPSSAMLGGVTPTVTNEGRGITCEYALQTSVISLSPLRMLGLGDEAVACLVGIGLAAHSIASATGYSLRSRCELLAEEQVPSWELVRDGSTLQCDDPTALLADVEKLAKKSNLPWEGVFELVPSETMKTLVAEGLAKMGNREDKDGEKE